MSNDKYSLIIMRDSTQKVRTFRLGAQRLKALIYIFIILVLLTTAGIIFSFHSIKKYAVLSSEISSLKASLAEAEIKLERLQNVQEILKDSEEAARTQNPMDTGPASEPLQAGDLQPPLAYINATEVVTSVFPNAAILEQNAIMQNSTVQNPTGQNFTNSSTQNLIQPSAQPGAESDLPLSPAKISKVTIKARSPKTISVSFDLHNATQGQTLSGVAGLSLLTKNGEVLDVVVPKTHMDFQINYYKRMSTTFPLPAGITPQDISALQVKITANGKEYQKESFPFP